jgi:hypothetical protein
MPPRRSRYSRQSRLIKKTKSKAKSRRSTGRSRRSRFSGGCWLSDLFKSKKSNNGSNAANKSKANNNAAMRRILQSGNKNISVPLEEVQNYTQLNSITKSIQNSKPAWLQNSNAKKRVANKYRNENVEQNVSLINPMMRKPDWMRKPNEPPTRTTFRPQAIKRNNNQQQ